MKAATQQKEPVEGIGIAAEVVIPDAKDRDSVLNYVVPLVMGLEAPTPQEAISALTISMGTVEQDIDPNKVNILTMHKAKGLTAGVVFVVAAEDEYIPGVNEGAREGDERRLLYVSLTRAKHKLFITYCTQRTGRQKHTGRTTGEATRTLTRFLRDGPKKSERGLDYLARQASTKGGIRTPPAVAPSALPQKPPVDRGPRYDGKFVLRTNTTLPAGEVAVQYKRLLLVERFFRAAKSLLETRPTFHQWDATIRGHVFCSFLALVLLDELKRRLGDRGWKLGWEAIRQDLEALAEVEVREGEHRHLLRTPIQGVAGKVLQAVGVAIPPPVRPAPVVVPKN